MRYRLLFGMLVPAAATVSAFAGCDTLGNGCNTNCCGTNPRPLQPAPPQLLYPIPGATGVPTAAGSLVFSGTPAPGLTAELLGGATPVALFIAPPAVAAGDAFGRRNQRAAGSRGVPGPGGRHDVHRRVQRHAARRLRDQPVRRRFVHN
jgi:hypothetical protein